MNHHSYRKTDMIKSMELNSLNGYMEIDLDSMVSLNILSNGEDGKKSVIDLFDKCGSRIGKSSLNKYLMRPLYDKKKINDRLEIISSILFEMEGGYKQSIIRQILDCIRTMPDICKVVNSLQVGEFKGSIWKQLRVFLINMIRIRDIIDSSDVLLECKVFRKYIENIDVDLVRKLRSELERVLDYESDIDNVSIQFGYNAELQNLQQNFDKMENILLETSNQLTNRFGTEIITAYIPQFGYLIAIEKGNENNEYEGFEIVFNTSTTFYYKNETMREMDERFGDLYSLIRDKEIEVLYELKNRLVNKGLNNILDVYPFIGEIDVMICFALVSKNFNLTRPEIIDDDDDEEELNCITLTGSFNILMRDQDFISNDIKITKDKKMMVITGPNYSGKSTILVQIGITIYLTQVGCYIPAKFGKLKIFANILTRINTLDSINCSQSTFMKDCQQMSKCIYKNTKDSLVLIDEFGKGTDVNDGPGLLGSIIKYFLNLRETPIVLISTHLTEIFEPDMIGMDEGINFKQMKVIVAEDIDSDSVHDDKKFDITYLYEMIDGITKDSGGLYCAYRCGIDKEIIEKAKFILDIIDRGGNIIEEFSELDEEEINLIDKDSEKMKRFLQLNFQDWENKDVNKLREELLKIVI